MLEPTKVDACKNEGSTSHFRRLDHIERSFICAYDDCYKSYTRLSHLKRHEDTHDKSYRCIEESCMQNFKSKFSLKKHVDNVHLKKNRKKYKCSHCDQEFNKHSWLTRHQYRHTGVKPYICPEEGCEKRFLVPSKLKRHLKTHEGYTCAKENCGKVFPKWTLYIKHVKNSHPTIYKCHYCEKEFSTSFNLKAHSEVHKFDREVFLCPKPNCSRFYFMKRNLTHHLHSYHEKRPFVCIDEHCHKAFKSEEDLNAHLSQHDPKKRIRRKKKKNNPKPSFADRLAGCVPRKIRQPKNIIAHQSEEASEGCPNISDEKHQDVPYLITSDDKKVPEEENKNLLCLTSIEVSEEKNQHVHCLTSDYSMDDGIQTLLNMINKRKTFCSETTVGQTECISA